MSDRIFHFGRGLSLCVCAAVSVCQTAFSGGWTWAGKTGMVRIPSGDTAQVVDDDVDVVAALTGIEIQSGATLHFANTGKRCVLAATLSGDGSCTAGEGALVTFAGESPDYTGEMIFTEAKVHVSSPRWGLGCGTGPSGEVRYVSSDAGVLQFVADGVCDPGILWYDHRSETSNPSTWFVDDMKRKVVFNGPVKMNKSGNVDWIRTGNFVFNAGLGVNGSNGNFGVYVGDPSSDVVTEIANVAMSGGSVYFPIRIEANAELLLKAGVTGSDIVFYGQGKVVCGAADVLPQRAACGLGRGDMKSGTIDLNGFDQTVKQFSCAVRTAWAWNVTKGEEGHVTVTSASDAALKIVGNVSPLPHACGFSGRASLVQAGSGVYTLVNQFSETQGDLRVENGTVKFDWGAGWGGNIEVFEKGRVVFADRCEENFSDPCTLKLHEGAKIEIAKDVMLVCEKMTAGGVEIPEGIYTAENCGGWIAGDGSVMVKKAAGAYTAVRGWDGGAQSAHWGDAANWSGDTVPGAGEKAVIPSGATVQVADADAESVAVVAAIEIEKDGKLEFVNSGAAVSLAGDISGAGDVRSSGSAGITLAGWNFDHLGSMEFTNTPVYVTSRCGLGNPSRAIVHWGADKYALRFRGDGLTNDVPVKFQGVRDAYATRFTDSYGDHWVQNGYLDYLSQSDSPRIGCGNYSFTGGLRNSAGALQFLVQEGMTCTVRKTPLALNINWSWSLFNAAANSTVRLETSDNRWTEDFSLSGSGRFLCCTENALFADKPLNLARDNEATVLDLGGYDQKCLFVRNVVVPNNKKYEASRGSAGYGLVTSESAATLTLTSAGAVPAAVRFSGAVDLACIGSGVNTFVNQFSDSTGTLTVTNGTVKFDWGAGWGGDIDIRHDGRVEFAETCSGTCTSRETGAVSLSGSAKLSVAAGARYCCGSIKLGEVLITSGVLSAQTHPEWIEGGGAVYVGKRGLILTVR